MQILIYIAISYLIIGVLLVWRDFFDTDYAYAPRYVSEPSAGSIIYALFRKPFIENNIFLLLLKVGILAFIIRFMVNYFF